MADKAVAMIRALQAAVQVVVHKVAALAMQAARRAARLAVAHRVAARLVVDRRAVDRKAAAQTVVRLAAAKDLAAPRLVFQCRVAAGFQVFRVLAPAVRLVAVVSQAAARPRAAVELRAVHRMKASSEDRAAAVVPPALLVVKRAAKAVKQVAVRPVVLLDRWAVAPKAAWRAVVLPARWVAEAIQVAACPVVPANPEVLVRQAERVAMPVAQADRPAPVQATAAAPAGALVAPARVVRAR